MFVLGGGACYSADFQNEKTKQLHLGNQGFSTIWRLLFLFSSKQQPQLEGFSTSHGTNSFRE